MNKLRTLKCKTGAIIERLITDDVTSVKCNCGKVAIKTISAAKYFGNTTGKSPSA